MMGMDLLQPVGDRFWTWFLQNRQINMYWNSLYFIVPWKMESKILVLFFITLP